MAHRQNNKDDRSGERIADEIIDGLTEFRDALRDGDPIEQRFTVRTVELRLDPKPFSPEEVRELRRSFRASQTIFARLIGVSPSTLRNWEQGLQPPPTWGRRLLELMQRDPAPWTRMLEEAHKSNPASSN
ncbi:MAG: hypothetical protein EA423_12690 [Phycisphaerales bacterium]|nr:MAG: hypothetical protein EA423_12690 [Phycisphaerales bacterium]